MSKTRQVNQTTVLILAAGRGARMRELTQHTPKPLIKLGQHSLIEHHLMRLAALGFKDIVINIAYLAEQISAALGDGSRYGLRIRYSDESSTGALETAGGIANALPLLKSDHFIVINSDIYTDFDYRQLLDVTDHHAHLVLVPNPAHNPLGDFGLTQQGIVVRKKSPEPTYTFSGIARYAKLLFSDVPVKKQPLSPVFDTLIQQGTLHGCLYNGLWQDVGTPERLKEIEQEQPLTTESENNPALDV
ncbi:mannose-1-phosphate guanylyltransferase [Arenicella chitinivorans]|uniref:Mannose-1-phosphate guanylyltransferase n=1 Tax=Arenicella chitinivorans TaxID=1329800 RepID=A0A918RYW8_9GAMM|nr:nucleotidyltransferase family protein [Arenicella chitinivorans]GHA16043.1 mannose-1-phosphate guanylyltransferase [Arenicella chitinivorans]